MMVVLGSIFRNSTAYLPRYGAQVAALRDALAARGDVLGLVLAEGDSTDGTWDALTHMLALRGGVGTAVLKREHGGPLFGSVDNAHRWRQISYACNGVLEAVPAECDAFIYVESDLIWQAPTMLSLLAHLDRCDAVAPMSFHVSGRFYDTWGYRAGGAHFCGDPPYYPGIVAGGLTPIESAGSCIVTRGDVARSTRFDPPQESIVGWCKDMRRHGYTLWLDSSLKVEHP